MATVYFTSSNLTRFTRNEREVMVAASTIRGVIEELVERYGKEFKDMLLDVNNQPKPTFSFLLNGVSAGRETWVGLRLKEGDRLYILAGVRGGCSRRADCVGE